MSKTLDKKLRNAKIKMAAFGAGVLLGTVPLIGLGIVENSQTNKKFKAVYKMQSYMSELKDLDNRFKQKSSSYFAYSNELRDFYKKQETHYQKVAEEVNKNVEEINKDNNYIKYANKKSSWTKWAVPGAVLFLTSFFGYERTREEKKKILGELKKVQ